MYDVIVVGGGHNGLVCAAFMAKAGKKVLVVEARHIVGGFCTTAELLPNAPGYRINRCGSEFILTSVAPSVVDELQLDRHGLKWVTPDPDPVTTYLGPNGASLGFWRSLDRTVAEIKRFSPRDAARYERMADVLNAFLDTTTPYLMGHPRRVRPQVLMTMALRLAKYRGKVGVGARILSSSVDSVLEEWFERDELKCPLGAYSLANFGPMQEAGSAFSMCVIPGFHKWGIRRPVGGSINFPEALVNCITSYGGEVRTSTRVREVLVRDGKARGICVENGDEILSTQVVGAVDPHTLITKLLHPSVVPSEVQDQIRGMAVNRFNIYTFKVDAAVSQAPVFPDYPTRDREACSVVTLCPSMDVLRRSMDAYMAGELVEEPPLIALIHSVQDRTLVPPRSSGDTLYFYLTAAPYELSGGRAWSAEKDKFKDVVLQQFNTYAPNTLDNLIDSVALAPPEFETEYNAYRGTYNHVDPVLQHMGPGRPIPAMSAWKTPVNGLWHSASGSFPMGWISGWPGRSTAREVLRTLK